LFIFSNLDLRAENAKDHKGVIPLIFSSCHEQCDLRNKLEWDVQHWESPGCSSVLHLLCCISLHTHVCPLFVSRSHKLSWSDTKPLGLSGPGTQFSSLPDTHSSGEHLWR
jgi:hypothetical protein